MQSDAKRLKMEMIQNDTKGFRIIRETTVLFDEPLFDAFEPFFR